MRGARFPPPSNHHHHRQRSASPESRGARDGYGDEHDGSDSALSDLSEFRPRKRLGAWGSDGPSAVGARGAGGRRQRAFPNNAHPLQRTAAQPNAVDSLEHRARNFVVSKSEDLLLWHRLMERFNVRRSATQPGPWIKDPNLVGPFPDGLGGVVHGIAHPPRPEQQRAHPQLQQLQHFQQQQHQQQQQQQQQQRPVAHPMSPPVRNNRPGAVLPHGTPAHHSFPAPDHESRQTPLAQPLPTHVNFNSRDPQQRRQAEAGFVQRNDPMRQGFQGPIHMNVSAGANGWGGPVVPPNAQPLSPAGDREGRNRLPSHAQPQPLPHLQHQHHQQQRQQRPHQQQGYHGEDPVTAVAGGGGGGGGVTRHHGAQYRQNSMPLLPPHHHQQQQFPLLHAPHSHHARPPNVLVNSEPNFSGQLAVAHPHHQQQPHHHQQQQHQHQHQHHHHQQQQHQHQHHHHQQHYQHHQRPQPHQQQHYRYHQQAVDGGPSRVAHQAVAARSPGHRGAQNGHGSSNSHNNNNNKRGAVLREAGPHERLAAGTNGSANGRPRGSMSKDAILAAPLFDNPQITNAQGRLLTGQRWHLWRLFQFKTVGDVMDPNGKVRWAHVSAVLARDPKQRANLAELVSAIPVQWIDTLGDGA